MISRIRGELLEADAGRVEVLLSGGVAYEVHVPLTVFQRLPRPGSQVDLKTVLVVREDAHSLFGFLEDHERALFNRLCTTPKVGAKVALAMMSTFPTGRLARILSEKDARTLTQVSGVGKKLAELAVVHLADKVQDLLDAGQPERPPVRPGARGRRCSGAPGLLPGRRRNVGARCGRPRRPPHGRRADPPCPGAAPPARRLTGR